MSELLEKSRCGQPTKIERAARYNQGMDEEHIVLKSKKLGTDLGRFKVQNKEVESWKLMCEEMTKWFGKSCYWLPYKFNRYKIEQAYSVLKKEGDREFTHLLQRLYNN